MKYISIITALLFLSTPALAADAGDTAIATLGEISGIALACKQPAIASQARNAVATTVHKTRANGEVFENANNDAYLAQGKGKTCPDSPTLTKRLREAEQNLSQAFAPK
jgi:hypothetical protein